MANYIDADKLKAEIERLKTVQLKRIQEGDLVDAEPYDKNEAYNELLSFLDTLESEKPINPEDAMKLLEEKIALVKQRGTWDGVDVDKYMDEVRGRGPEKPMNQDGLGEEIQRFLSNATKMDKGEWKGKYPISKMGFSVVAHYFAKWGAEHLATSGKTLEIKPGDEVTINGYKFVYDKGKGYVTIVKSEESVPNDLEEAAKKFVGYDMDCDELRDYEIGIAAFIAGAKWMEEQLKK